MGSHFVSLRFNQTYIILECFFTFRRIKTGNKAKFKKQDAPKIVSFYILMLLDEEFSVEDDDSWIEYKSD